LCINFDEDARRGEMNLARSGIGKPITGRPRQRDRNSVVCCERCNIV